MEEDWDNLIILDACRYDLFEEVNSIEGELSAAISAGSNTSEFLMKNFDGAQYNDTVYISANPQIVYNGVDKNFYHLEKLWTSHWDDELRTVVADDVVERTLELTERFSDKRYIIHMLQPHYPFIGETGQAIEHGTVVEIDEEGKAIGERGAESIWDKLQSGRVDRETVWGAYRENLELTLPAVQKLVDNLGGKTIVTSDHGNAFGEWGLYGHPGGYFTSHLVDVPWLVVPSDERRDVVAEPRVSPTQDESESEIVRERLSDLGYT